MPAVLVEIEGPAVGCLLTMPRVFSHAHYAHYDMPMSCLWVLAQLAFLESLRSRRWAVPFGIALGLAAGTKITGLFAALPPILWWLSLDGPRALRRLIAPPWRGIVPPTRPRAFSVLAIGLPVAALTLLAIQPPWWGDPIAGVTRFLNSNLTRSATKPIPSMYLGEFYAFSLPWHNTLVILAVTVPVMTLLLAVVGMVAAFRPVATDRDGLLWVLSWGVLMVVRALPVSPGHDVERLFLPSFLSVAILAGLGATAIAMAIRGRLRPLAIVLAVAAVVEGVVGIVQLYPYTLSYYNVAIGGLPGAERRGLELTYYWDTFGPELLGWIRDRDHAQPGGAELRFPSQLVNVPLLREWGAIPGRTRILGEDAVDRPDYILQRRRGFFYPYDWWLERHGAPIFAIRRQGVDLLRVYTFEGSARAYEATRDDPIPIHLRN